MQLLTLHRIIKALYLVSLFVVLASQSVVYAQNADLASSFAKAQKGEIAITELVDLLIQKAIKSPAVGPEVNRYRHSVPSLSQTAAPLLITQIQDLILEHKTEDAWAVKSLADILIPNTWPEGIRIAKIFSVVTSLETIKQEQNFRALGAIDLTNIGKEDSEFLEKIIKSYADEIIDQAINDPDHFNGIKKLAELSVSFSDPSLKEKAGQILAALSKESNWQNSKWTLDNPIVQQFVADLFQDNREILVKLYQWRILGSVAEANHNRAAIYYNLLLPQLSEEEKTLFRKELLNSGLQYGMSSFLKARVDELKAADQLTLSQKLKLMFKGYYGWLPMLVPLCFISALFVVIYKKRPAKRKFTPKVAVTDDEYTRLLKKLNLGEDANEGQIKKAFRQLVKEHHPDAHGAGGVVLDSDGNVDQKFEDLRKTYDRIMEIRKSWFGASR